jgi:hypothetical protein
VGSNEDDRTRTAASSKAPDDEVAKEHARRLGEWERAKTREEEVARELGRRIAAHVEADRRASEIVMSRAPSLDLFAGETEEERKQREAAIAAGEARLAEEARVAKKRQRGKRYAAAIDLQRAVREQCVVEWGAIFGFPFREEHGAILFRGADVRGDVVEAREIYGRLREAMNDARRFAGRANGIGGSAGEALRLMRRLCLLPNLHDLNTPPFDDTPSDGRAGLVRDLEALAQSVYERRLEDRELAIGSLLAGNVPAGSYETLLRQTKRTHPKGLTTSQVVDREARYVRGVRLPPSKLQT